jgi:hypothetical protein
MSTVAFPLPGNHNYTCQNCSGEWYGEELKPIKDFELRVEPGEVCPAGECPDCGAVCHLTRDDKSHVVVTVKGGVASVTKCAPGVTVEIDDQDVRPVSKRTRCRKGQ